MNIEKGLQKEYFNVASTLIINSLGDKLLPLLGNKNKAIKIIEQSINADNCFCAFIGSELSGIIAFQEKNDSFLSFKLKNLISAYGFWGGVLRAIKLSALIHKIKDDEIYIEAIAVNEEYRSMGIGKQLIEALSKIAKDKNYKTISLEVINTNLRAKALYNRLGFKFVKTNSIKPFNKILHLQFDEAFFMEKRI